MKLNIYIAPWSNTCENVKNLAIKLAEEYNIKYEIKYVDETDRDELRKLSVRTVPTCTFVEDGSMIDRVEGEFTEHQGHNWFGDVLGITLDKERKGELPEKHG